MPNLVQAARRLMSSPHCERRAPIDTTDATVHKTKRQAVSSVYSHTMSQFSALIVHYIIIIIIIIIITDNEAYS